MVKLSTIKLTYIYLEMPNFKLREDELNTRLDKWLYFIRHLEDFQNIPSIFKDEVFIKAFEKAELTKLGQAELDSYENSLKIYRDLKGVIDTAFDDGKAEGKIEGKIESKIEIATALKESGVPINIISKATGLSGSEIENL